MSDLSDPLAPASARPLPSAVPLPPPDDPWLQRMVPRVELAIDDLVRGAELPAPPAALHPITVVEIANETTLAAARRLGEAGKHPLVVNMANGGR